jgi:hypothetical protein
MVATMTQATGDAGTLTALVDALGFRRLDGLHLRIDGTRTTAEVSGVAHRLPTTMRVSLRTANRLIAAGAPVHMSEPTTSSSRGG